MLSRLLPFTGIKFLRIAMQSNQPSSPLPNERMLALAQALAETRDLWVQMSLSLKDMMTEQESPQRDEVMTEIQRYLARLNESGR
jgi:hypothetical protein